MTRRTGWMAALPALLLTVALPYGAQAQAPTDQKKAAPAKPAAPAARPAPPQRAAPPPAARAPAPSFRAPPPAARSAPPPQRQAPVVRSAPPQPRRDVQRPNIQRPAQVVRPPQAAPNVNRTVRQQQRQERIQQRQQDAQPRTLSTQQSQPRTLSTQQVQRQERTLRQRENRELRRLPPAQRAAKRQEFQRAREQRVQQRLQPQAPATFRSQPSVQTNVAPAPRRNGQPRITTQAARQGRFGAAFAANTQFRDMNRYPPSHFAPHRAWRRGERAGFVAWYGPVFWPYAYSDIFDYTFWPYGYDDGYWAYAYDDFFDGVFWGEQGPPEEYAYAPAAPRSSSSAQAPRYAAVQELCKQPGTGITAWPFAEIEQKVGLNAEQKALLGDVRKAGQDAGAVFKASCPTDNVFPLTPPGRLQSMTARLKATQQAVQTVRPALEKFYNSLSDEQKERFNAIGPKKPTANAEASQAQDAKSCKEPKAGLSNLPIEKIEDVVKPTEAQEASLTKLQEATDKAVGILQAACPDDTPVTPPGRLEMMDKRLTAMIDAATTVQPALTDFYGSLTNEQKARFNRIGRDLAQADKQ